MAAYSTLKLNCYTFEASPYSTILTSPYVTLGSNNYGSTSIQSASTTISGYLTIGSSSSSKSLYNYGDIYLHSGGKIYFNNSYSTNSSYIQQTATNSYGALTLSSYGITLNGYVTCTSSLSADSITINSVKASKNFSKHKYITSSSSSIYLGYSSLKATSSGSAIVNFTNTTTTNNSRSYKVIIVPTGGSAGSATIGNTTQTSSFSFSMIEMFIFPAREATTNGNPNTSYIIRIYPNTLGQNTSTYTSIANIYEYRQIVGNQTSSSIYYIKMNTTYELFLDCFSNPEESW